jgi:2-oxo-hept-3-ene-1,7-dioate hydratase/2-keto-4-pentenoate hydratase
MKEKKQISLLTKEYPEIEIEDSYHIQEFIIDSLKNNGQEVKGYKIGLTSKLVQEMIGTTEPDFSPMTDSMFIMESSTLKSTDWISPLVELEISFVIKEKLSGPKINAADIIRKSFARDCRGSSNCPL